MTTNSSVNRQKPLMLLQAGCKEPCHSGKLKLAYTSPNVIPTSPKNILMSRVNFTVLL